MMQTSNTFGERITYDMGSSLKDQVEKLRVQELQIARRLSTGRRSVAPAAGGDEGISSRLEEPLQYHGFVVLLISSPID